MLATKTLLATFSVLLSLRPSLASPGLTGALIVDDVGQPDPCIFHDTASGTYYCYADAGRLVSSKEINTGWQAQPNYTVVHDNGDPWTTGIGAPSVGCLNNTYVMYFASGEKIQVATSPSPTGPFKVQATPLLQPGPQPTGTPTGKKAFPAAPALFQHAGTNYILYKYGRANDYNHISSICIRSITPDGLTATGKGVQLFTVTSGTEEYGRQFTEDEGPNMVYNNGTFYLFFNAGSYCATDYQIVYATSKILMPETPYTYRGVLLQTSPPTYDGVTLKAPGGISFVDESTFIFMSYQPDAKPSCGGAKGTLPSRYIHAGQLVYNADGTVGIAETWTS